MSIKIKKSEYQDYADCIRSDQISAAGVMDLFKDKAFLFVDGRYTIQAENQCDKNIFEIRNIPKNSLIDCINESFEEKALIAYDPWLHTIEQILEIHSNKKKNITRTNFKAQSAFFIAAIRFCNRIPLFCFFHFFKKHRA